METRTWGKEERGRGEGGKESQERGLPQVQLPGEVFIKLGGEGMLFLCK